MQKLTGISSGQNNKSCRIIHNGSSKIGFTFFLFFCNFLRNLQETAKSLHYWSYPFAVRPLKSFPPLQCSPRGGRPARAARFRRSPVAGPVGDGPGRVYGSLWLSLGARLVGRCRRWAAHRQPGGTGRRGWPSRRGGPRAVAYVGRRATVELEECAGDLGVALGVAGRGGRVPGSVASAACARGGRPAP
jgi:hypothetical protein